MDFLGVLAENKEWGLIILGVWFLWRLQKSNDKREKRLTDAFLKIADDIPELTKSINDLFVGLKEVASRFDKAIEERDEKARVYMDTIDYVSQEVTVHSGQISDLTERVDTVEEKTNEQETRIAAVEEAFKPDDKTKGKRKSAKR